MVEPTSNPNNVPVASEAERTIVNRILAVIVEKGNLSIGRLMLFTCFILAMVRWTMGEEIPESMLTILMVMIGYIFGGKVVGQAKEAVENVSSMRKTIKDSLGEEKPLQ